MDKYGRDQFVIRYMDETEIYWNDTKRGQPELVSCVICLGLIVDAIPGHVPALLAGSDKNPVPLCHLTGGVALDIINFSADTSDRNRVNFQKGAITHRLLKTVV